MPKLIVDATGNTLTYAIIGAAMTVHNHLGAGLKEEVYENALFVELNQLGIMTERQVQVFVDYGGEIVGVFYLDLLSENQVVIEVKALSHLLTNDEVAQVVNYLKGCRKTGRFVIHLWQAKIGIPADSAARVEHSNTKGGQRWGEVTFLL